MSLKIGNTELKHGLMLAPMAGVTDYSFRRLCREAGAEWIVSEMLSAKSFLVMGINVFGSAFFTALNNGGVSAFISLSRTFVFQILAILFLPSLLGLDGIWLAVVAAELASILVTAFFFALMKSRYRY